MTAIRTFTGIHFDENTRYCPALAKDFLDDAMQEIRASGRLHDIGADPSLRGRGDVPAKDFEVWDSVRLHGADESDQVNALPHFTLSLRPDAALAVLIVPNRWLDVAANREKLGRLGYDGFRDRIAKVTSRLIDALGSSLDARPWVLVQHRRSTKGQQLDALDGVLQFDPQTAIGPVHKESARLLKEQPQWLESAYAALVNKNANLEMALGGRFSYGGELIRTRDFLDRVIDSWAACEPLLTALHSPN